MGFFKEFKDFIVKGNAFDMAVGLMIATVFGAVVTSLVQDVLMPPIGALMSGVDFSQMSYELKPKEGDKAAVVLGYGKFINALIALVIQGFAIFVIVKIVNSLKKKPEPAAPSAPAADIQLLTEIRDLLKKS